jgi:hypothetical protein
MLLFAAFVAAKLYRFSSNVPFWELDYPLSGATDIGISYFAVQSSFKKGDYI